MDNKLEIFIWELTQRFNLRCSHCGSDYMSSFSEKELGKKEALHVAKDLEAFEIKKMVFSGGEPLLCPYWRELPKMFEMLQSIGVASWQIQPAVPSGRMKDHKNKLLTTDEIWTMIQFAHDCNTLAKSPLYFWRKQ